jgi:hypothetical protein
MSDPASSAGSCGSAADDRKLEVMVTANSEAKLLFTIATSLALWIMDTVSIY